MKNMFPQRLTELMNERGVSKRAVAQAVGVSAMSVTAWTINNVQPSAENIYSVAEYFGVTSDYLLGLENENGEKINSRPQK